MESVLVSHAAIYIGLAVVFGLFMAWGIGANDVANAMGTSVGSKSLTFKQAVMIAAVFELAGAVLAGGEVTATIRKGIIDVSSLGSTPELLVYGMLASLLAAGIWLLVASRQGWPVSTTHSIVGAIVGFGAVGIGMDAVHWDKVGTIVGSWVSSPLLAGTISFLLFRSIQKLVIDTDNPVAMAKRYVPIYIFIVGFVIAMVTMVKGLKHVGISMDMNQNILVAAAVGVAIMLIGSAMIRRINIDPDADRDFHFTNMEKIFGVLMIFTAMAIAFAHGSNDVANAIGPVSAVVAIVQSAGEIASKSATPAWILWLGGGGIVLGLATYGHKVIATVGSGITELTPSRGFAATLGAAVTIVLASAIGLPISTTHTLVGGVLGVGLARGIGALNGDVIKTIFMSWIVTLPAGAGLAICFFFIFKGIFT
ncbi:MAG: phosphate permease [Zetaproteobacteria bacterium CG_4_9_14_3_um_filter_49_83]|nr:MAG: phosphate permease [Zetaproteobacteria bacterium CG1_02_49_23]PIQ31479.1 MAG: phosphate permease [Zetaproteobacteria bacterium CG17_big_fil_post_rev_8_21_14_2_50_50_13]PIV31354.1 MAG: phosphate permease [Zetaproteobacteria bacterium CG02_land_8_20_14_3_00_50_9]PIY54642.1 MAG: phosphate permease [Zetaproteobacteria bacterium CG_4_10_14_0_8_um_filter_49_80]PJA35628.1 MAG: phosphate permease [Zetaproteobacteria bacterium CG_4_9_14_3_um_filter_49_83]